MAKRRGVHFNLERRTDRWGCWLLCGLLAIGGMAYVVLAWTVAGWL